jgi:hypothetical protein
VQVLLSTTSRKASLPNTSERHANLFSSLPSSWRQVLLFGIVAISVKRKAPNAHTFPEIIKARCDVMGGGQPCGGRQ